jgi:hypothetical protein
MSRLRRHRASGASGPRLQSSLPRPAKSLKATAKPRWRPSRTDHPAIHADKRAGSRRPFLYG